MSITVFFRKEKHIIEKESITAGEILDQLKLSRQAFLMVRDLQLVTEGETIKDGEEVRIIAVISGGSCRL